MLIDKNMTPTTLRQYILDHPSAYSDLTFQYGGGYLRFWRVSRDSISALDGTGNRISFKLDSDYLFQGECFMANKELPMKSRGGRVCF